MASFHELIFKGAAHRFTWKSINMSFCQAMDGPAA